MRERKGMRNVREEKRERTALKTRPPGDEEDMRSA